MTHSTDFSLFCNELFFKLLYSENTGTAYAKILRYPLDFFFNWSIADLQCWVSFRCMAKWVQVIIRLQDIEYSSLCYSVSLCCLPSLDLYKIFHINAGRKENFHSIILGIVSRHTKQHLPPGRILSLFWNFHFCLLIPKGGRGCGRGAAMQAHPSKLHLTHPLSSYHGSYTGGKGR